MKRSVAVAFGAASLVGCGTPIRIAPITPTSFAFALDTFRVRVVDRGVSHYFIYSAVGPWAIHMLDVRLQQCLSAVAVKGASGAIGRAKTSDLLKGLDKTRDVRGGVNADFFLFTPPGVPTNALISGGRLVTGPSMQPVFATDARGTPMITTLSVRGSATVAGRTVAIDAWNRAAPAGLTFYDRAWSGATDTLSGALEMIFANGRLTQLDSATAGVTVPANGGVLVLARDAPDSLRARVREFRVGDSVSVSVALSSPISEAVGGRPRLVRDSAIVADVDTTGQPGFATGRHPRTAVGIGANKRRLLLVVVDGRQARYSEGMTLRELANLMLSLGARDALNLDGGGSTTMVVENPKTRVLEIVNRPSDAAGERPVADALAIVKRCAR